MNLTNKKNQPTHHKDIGTLYLIFGILSSVVVTGLSALTRFELSVPENIFFSLETQKEALFITEPLSHNLLGFAVFMGFLFFGGFFSFFLTVRFVTSKTEEPDLSLCLPFLVPTLVLAEIFSIASVNKGWPNIFLLASLGVLIVRSIISSEFRHFVVRVFVALYNKFLLLSETSSANTFVTTYDPVAKDALFVVYYLLLNVSFATLFVLLPPATWSFHLLLLGFFVREPLYILYSKKWRRQYDRGRHLASFAGSIISVALYTAAFKESFLSLPFIVVSILFLSFMDGAANKKKALEEYFDAYRKDASVVAARSPVARFKTQLMHFQMINSLTWISRFSTRLVLVLGFLLFWQEVESGAQLTFQVLAGLVLSTFVFSNLDLTLHIFFYNRSLTRKWSRLNFITSLPHVGETLAFRIIGNPGSEVTAATLEKGSRAFIALCGGAGFYWACQRINADLAHHERKHQIVEHDHWVGVAKKAYNVEKLEPEHFDQIAKWKAQADEQMNKLRAQGPSLGQAMGYFFDYMKNFTPIKIDVKDTEINIKINPSKEVEPAPSLPPNGPQK